MALNNRLKDLVQNTMDRETYKYLLKTVQYEVASEEKTNQKEKCCHSEYYAMQSEFSID